MRLISWNVNGLRACVNKGFLDFFKEIDADIFCIQESKLQEGQIQLELERVPSVLELCGEEGIFRDSNFHQSRALVGDIWDWQRGA